jgi:protein-S-isoprenylcysteine O-methyltransferase Ste14
VEEVDLPLTAVQRLWTELVIGFAVIGLVVFVSAGSVHYWQAWVYLAVSAGTSLLVTLRIVRDPLLVKSRTRGGPKAEQRPIQKLIVVLLIVPCVGAFIVPGLDRRFGWSSVPSSLCIAGDVLIVVSMWLVDRVFKANSFGSATVEIAEGQKVISTGPYAIVRNPMYSSAALYFVGVSLALGSYWGLIAAVLVILGFVWRLFDEEALLARELPGYAEYCGKVRWHLIPRVF